MMKTPAAHLHVALVTPEGAEDDSTTGKSDLAPQSQTPWKAEEAGTMETMSVEGDFHCPPSEASS